MSVFGTGCEEYHFLHEGLCMLDCPERFFEDKEQGRCLQCHLDCALCDGPNSNDCDACTDTEATLHNGACLGACPSHTFMDGITGDCKGTTFITQQKTQIVCLVFCEQDWFDLIDSPQQHKVVPLYVFISSYTLWPSVVQSMTKTTPSLLKLMLCFLSCRAPFIHFLNYILCYAWACFPTEIAALLRWLTGSCQTLKTAERCQRQFPRERHTALILLFKNTEVQKCCRRCPLLLLLKVAANGNASTCMYLCLLCGEMDRV